MRFHIIAMIVLSSYAFAASGSTGAAVVRIETPDDAYLLFRAALPIAKKEGDMCRWLKVWNKEENAGQVSLKN